MKLGRVAFAAIALALALAGCMSPAPSATKLPEQPQASAVASPTEHENVEGKVVVDEAQVEAFTKVILASCKRANDNGLIVDIIGEDKTIYRATTLLGVASPSGSDQFTRIGSKFELGGWPDGDPLCSEAAAIQNVAYYAKNDPTNGAAKSILREVSSSEFKWAVHRGSADLNFYTVQITNALVSRIESNKGVVYEISYGPFEVQIEQTFKKVLNASGYQYMYLGDQLWEMALPKAKIFCEKNGLILAVAESDTAQIAPSGDASATFNPKRMNVNVMNGQIVGVWPG